MYKFKISLQYTFLVFLFFAFFGAVGFLGLAAHTFVAAQTGLNPWIVTGVLFGLFTFTLVHFRVEYDKSLDWYFSLIIAVEKKKRESELDA